MMHLDMHRDVEQKADTGATCADVILLTYTGGNSVDCHRRTYNSSTIGVV